jgi:DNA polymerase-3 subunit alpha
MSLSRFEVHSHTHYSNLRLIDSITKPKDLIDRAIEIGLKGICVTDHECLSASIELNQYQHKIQKDNSNFKIGLGNEIYLCNDRSTGQIYYHLILIAKDVIGHKQLRKLSSIAWMNSYVDRGVERVPTLKEDLEKEILSNPGHIIATTACLGGELSSCILEMENARTIGDTNKAEKKKQQIIEFMEMMISLFGDDFYIECAPGASKEQIIANKKLLELSNCFNVPMVIGSDSHYLSKNDRYVHKTYLNSKNGEREVDSFYEYSYLQEENEIIEHLKYSYEYETIKWMFDNSMKIYDKIENYSLLHNQKIPKVQVKDYPTDIKPYMMNRGAYTWDKLPILTSMMFSKDKYERYWVNECVNKLFELDKYNDTYLQRLEEEARVKRIIGEKLGTNMFAYPITLQHYIDMFWESGSTVGAGRGSSCSGLNHYLLGVTQLDPIEWELPFWRYLNDERVELGDIDIDLCPSKRPAILEKIKQERGQFFNNDIDDLSKKKLGCTLIATFGTESTKAAILTACRGYRSEECPDGIDVDTAQYLSSLVPQERGVIWTLKDVVYGNQEKGRKPISLFVNEVEEYPGLLKVMMGIEGLISRRGSHASGVILFDEDPYEFGCFMRTPSGDVITQYDLHMAEAAGMTKYDFLLTDVQDKIAQAIKFLQEYGEIEKGLTLREAYDKYLHPSIINITKEDVWKAIQNNEIINVFQFDSPIGGQAAKKIAPKTMLELTDANGLMRLMTAEAGEETPMDKYIRFKNDIDLWYKEMDDFGLTKEEQKSLEPYFLKSYGVPPSQEQLMQMLMDPNLCSFTLAEANAARKVVGKKQIDKIPELKEKVLASAKRELLGEYIWQYGVGPQMGYAFSVIHALAYSFIGYQTATLGVNWNQIYWDTACLVVNSGSLEDEDLEIIENDEVEVVKKKEKGSDYTKIAKAIGDITSKGIEVSLVNINTSDYGYKPDAENNRILYGLKALSNINTEIIEKIIAGRPYKGIKDFMIRCPLSKVAMVNLIKAGAFDEIDKDFPDRRTIMAYYLSQVYGKKNRITLQNFNGLIQHNLVPKEYELEIRVYNFTKFLKANKKVGKYYVFDEMCLEFLSKFLPTELDSILQVINGIPCTSQNDWEKVYSYYMNNVREWIKENQSEILDTYNKLLFKEIWDKYASGNISHWEMQALCFYHSDHELKNVNVNKYGISNFNDLSEEPEVDYFFKRNNNNIPIYKLRRIIGTVIAKDDNRTSISLLTTTGVVNVKFTRDYYALFKKQISRINPDGTKTVMEKGWFTRGTMLMITGFRRDDTFVAKNYKKSGTHQLYKITSVNGDEMTLTNERWTGVNSVEEENCEE